MQFSIQRVNSLYVPKKQSPREPSNEFWWKKFPPENSNAIRGGGISTRLFSKVVWVEKFPTLGGNVEPWYTKFESSQSRGEIFFSYQTEKKNSYFIIWGLRVSACGWKKNFFPYDPWALDHDPDLKLGIFFSQIFFPPNSEISASFFIFFRIFPEFSEIFEKKLGKKFFWKKNCFGNFLKKKLEKKNWWWWEGGLEKNKILTMDLDLEISILWNFFFRVIMWEKNSPHGSGTQG